MRMCRFGSAQTRFARRITLIGGFSRKEAQANMNHSLDSGLYRARA